MSFQEESILFAINCLHQKEKLLLLWSVVCDSNKEMGDKTDFIMVVNDYLYPVFVCLILVL